MLSFFLPFGRCYIIRKGWWGGGDMKPPKTLKSSRKRSRARVPIELQCVLLHISLRIKIFECFKQPKLPYESHLSRHTSKTLKKIVKILETRPESSKHSQKWMQIQIHDVDKSRLVFGLQQLFCVPSWSLAQKT